MSVADKFAPMVIKRKRPGSLLWLSSEGKIIGTVESMDSASAKVSVPLRFCTIIGDADDSGTRI